MSISNCLLAVSILPANDHAQALTRFLAWSGGFREEVTAQVSLRASSLWRLKESAMREVLLG